MKRTKSQYARLVELDRQIRSGKRPNCLTFAEAWNVSQKTVQRDIDFLRDQCGAPMVFDRERRGFYYDNPSWWLPAIVLSEGELLAVLLAGRMAEQYRGNPVAGDIQRLFTKLAGMLPDKVSLNPELLFDRFSFVSPPARPVQSRIWTTVVRGLVAQNTMRVVYRPFDAATAVKGKESQINPCHLANLQGEWYLFAVHEGYTDVRQFAMSRFEKAVVTDKHFDLPPDFNPKRLLTGIFARYGGDGEAVTVRLLFDKEIAHWITERQWHPEQTLTPRKTGDIELAFPAKGLYEVQRWVLSWGRCVSVLEPAELKNSVINEVQAMASRSVCRNISQ